MLGKMKNTAVLFLVTAFLAAGCTRYAAFPGLEEGKGTLAADEQNAVYDDSVKPAAAAEKDVKPVKKAEQTKPEIEKQAEPAPVVKKEKSKRVKNLSRPNPEVEDIADSGISYAVPAKTTPVVIDDMDLTEMDAADGKTRVIKPVSESKTVVSVKKERRVVEPETAKKPDAEPSVFYLAETVYFNNGGSTVDSRYFASLRKIVREAKAHNGRIVVQGFASSRTRNTDIVSHKMANLKVSVARAENVAKLLVKYGMPRSRVITEGLSDSRPVYQEVMPEGERLNRRAEIYISY